MFEKLERLDNVPLPGIADLVESRPGDDPVTLAALLMEHAQHTGVALPTARGSARYLSIIDRIRGRQLLEDFGLQPFSVDWFAFHVPPGATGRLKIVHKHTHTSDVSLKVLGLGFGGGRITSLSLEDDYGERRECLLLRRTFEARFRVFEEITGDRYVQVDVERVQRDEQIAQRMCDRCAVGALAPGVVAPVAGVAIDLTHDPAGRSLSDTLKIVDDREIELSLPIKLPGFDITPGVALKRELELECSFGYSLPGGFCYTPFHDADGWRDFPYWLRT
jgi:hypothetical protein